jgi:hypothetical protein
MDTSTGGWEGTHVNYCNSNLTMPPHGAPTIFFLSSGNITTGSITLGSARGLGSCHATCTVGGFKPPH